MKSSFFVSDRNSSRFRFTISEEVNITCLHILLDDCNWIVNGRSSKTIPIKWEQTGTSWWQQVLCQDYRFLFICQVSNKESSVFYYVQTRCVFDWNLACSLQIYLVSMCPFASPALMSSSIVIGSWLDVPHAILTDGATIRFYYAGGKNKLKLTIQEKRV